MRDWKGCAPPAFTTAKGTFVHVEPFSAERDGQRLFDALGGDDEDLWRFIPFGPPESAEVLTRILSHTQQTQGWQTLVFRAPESGQVLGMASYMRIRPEAGSAEVGSVVFSTTLQRTPAATEAVFLMARHLFDDLGYRRFEWKCDEENEASRKAAERFGFTAEGVFRQDMVVKGRNRDTAWFSMIDKEWPRIRAAFTSWLAADNFDAAGLQKRSLGQIRAETSWSLPGEPA